MSEAEKLITENLEIWSSAVKTKSAAGRGKSNKLELYGIKKLRELILELAVRGLLVPQDPSDESAEELLKKVQAEKVKLEKQGSIKKQKVLPPIEEDQKSFLLPNGWIWSRIAELAQIGPRNEVLGDEEVSFVPMPLITTEYDGSHEQETKQWSEVKKGYTHFADGDIAVAKITPCFENSKAAIFSGLRNGIGAGTTELHVARPYGEHVNRRYLLCYLKSPEFLLVGEGKMTGTAGQKRLPKDFFSLNALPLPPAEEQHRIVAKVDELMALCDQLEQQQEASITAHQTLVKILLDALTSASEREGFTDAWARITEHFDTLFTTEWSIDQLKQTILQLAVMGKLVPQDSNDEPAGELLNKVAAEKARLIKEGEIKKQKALPPVRESDKPFRLPEGWVWCRVWDVAHTITSGSRDWAKYYADSGAIFVTMGNLSRNSYHLRLNTIRYVRPPADGEGNRTRLKENDLLISITGDVGNLGLIPSDFGEAYINQHTALLRFMPEFQDRYFPELMRTPMAKFLFDAPQRGVKNSFRLGDVGEMIIPLPPKQERLRIVAKLDNLIALCDTLCNRIKTANATKLLLADAISDKSVVSS